jgi:FAD dependent oxidoreductase TIGR03364
MEEKMNKVDVAIVGGGIVGLGLAWEAAERGRSVAVFERGPTAQLASIRNFGMVWPIGQTPGDWYDRAMKSRERWLRLRDEAGLWVNECGSLHAVYEADEWNVLEEFQPLAASRGMACELLHPRRVMTRFPHLKSMRLQGAMYSPTELCVDPREALATIPKFLAKKFGVRFHYSTLVNRIEMPSVTTSHGETWKAKRAFVCGGADFETLFPDVFADSGLVKCKLQMMATAPQPNGWKLGPHLAGGLTLGHYKSFEVCPGLAKVKARIAERYPLHVKYGIHVMASQNQLGEVVIGDSHEYGDAITPFDKEVIDRLILDYLAKMMKLPNLEIARRWHGIYAKHPSKVQFVAEPQKGCTIFASPGGAGITLAFGCAADYWENNP